MTAQPSLPAPRTLGLVLKGYPRISETFIINEIRLLEAAGLHIHIFSMRRPRESFSHAAVKDIQARVTYLPHSLLTGLPGLLWHNILLFFRLPENYLRTLTVFVSRFWLAPKKHTWLKHFLQAGWLIHHAEKDNIPHFHAHFAHTPAAVALYAAKLSQKTFSFFAHAKDIYTQRPEALRDIINRAQFVVTCTHYNLNYLKKTAPEKKQLYCVYHGIDTTLFHRPAHSRAAYTDPVPPYQILTIARFVEKKGLPVVIRALQLLRQRGIPFHYTLVGDGPQKHTVQALLARYNLLECSTLTGTLTHEEIIPLYEQADVFVLGCQEAADGDRDGIPNVVAESMAMGVPVAATTVSAIAELIQQGSTGLLAPPGDSAVLADNMYRLLVDTALRRACIPAARRHIEEVFDNRKCITRLIQIYQKEKIV